MANGVIGGELNISGLEEGIARIERKMTALSANMTRNSNNIINAFKEISTQGVDVLGNKLDALIGSMSKLGNGVGFDNLSKQAKNATDDVISLTNAVTQLGQKESAVKYTSGAVAKIEYEIDEKLKQLTKVQELLNFYAKGEGSKALGFGIDTTKMQAEANALMEEISLLDARLQKEKQIAQAKGEQIEKDKANTEAWISMEKEKQDELERTAITFRETADRNANITMYREMFDRMESDTKRYNEWLKQKHKEKEQEENVEKETANNRKKTIAEQNKVYQAEEYDRYKNWLRIKHEEAEQHKAVEKEKANATKEAIDEQKKAYAEDAKRQYEETLRMYRGLFDEIEEREKLAKQQSANRRKNYEDYVTSYEGAMRTSKKAHTYEQEAQAIKNLEQARATLSQKDKDYATKLNALNEAINRHKESLKQATLTDEQRAKISEENSRKAVEQAKREKEIEAKRRQSSSPQTAIDFSKSAKSINDQIKAIQYLKQARDKLNRGSFASEEEYRKKIEQLNNEIKRQQTEVDKLTNKNKNLSNSHRHLMDTAGQLQRKLALLFSVSAISGYFNKLVSVRGEFELQAKSLEVLLRNKDEANRLWNQTVQLAVKSPFTVKELVTYTKQLAAYRIESEKLFETNKMLADVSAGLGVDMNRLILAFGQVKAANFLRGTELRQFSEAGVNMLEELAKRFTALEGRVVSVGDVFERVSKRMVSFADVEAVFKTITSEGGTFYKMQEKQAETLRGMVTNLKDQIALMLNDIGMSNEGVLKGLVSLTVTLVKNWRDIVPLIDMVAGILITRLLQKGMVGILRMTKGVVPLLKQWRNALRGATVEATAMGTALGKVTKANAWLALIGIVASLGYAIYDVVTSASKLEEELGRIDTDLTQRLEESISGYINLAKSATDASKSMTEQREALSKLNSAYSDILPQYMLTHDYLKQLQGDYTDVTDAMRLYYETQAIEQKKAKIEETVGERINTDTTDLIGDIKDVIRGDETLSQELKDYLLSSVAGAVNSVVIDIKSGKVAVENITSEIFNRIADGSGIDAGAFSKRILFFGKGWESEGVNKNIRELTSGLKDYKEALEGIEGLPKTKVPLAEKADFEKAKANFDTLNQISNEWINIAQRIANGETTVIESFDELNKADLSQFSTEVSLAMTTFKQSLIDSANEGTVAFSETLPTLKTNFLDTINTIIQSSYKGNTAIEELGERISKLGDKDKLGEVAQDVYNAMKKIAEIQNIDIDVFKKVIPEATSSLDSYKKIVESRLETLKGVLKSYTESSQSLLRSTFAFRILQDAGFSDVEQIKKEIEALDLLFKGLGGSTKDTGKGSRNILAERIKLIRDAQKAYQDLNKDFDKNKAKTKVIDSYADAFKEIGLNIKDIDFTNVDGVVDALSELEQRGKLTNKQMADLKKAIAEVQLEKDRPKEQAKTKTLIKDIQKKIDKYELSVELDKIGIPKDIAKSLFGIEATDLAEIKKDLEKQISDLQQAGGSEDRIKDLQAELDKVNEMEAKALVERLKDYSKYLYKAMSKRTQITLDQLKKEKEIEKTFVLTEDVAKKNNWVDDSILKSLANAEIKLSEIEITTEKTIDYWRKLGFTEEQINRISEYNDMMRENQELAKKGVALDSQKALEKLQWDEFKGSEMYEQLFGDLGQLGTKTIDILISKLTGMKDTLKELPTEVYKEIQNSISKLESLKIERNPFKEFSKSLEEIKELNKITVEATYDVDGKSVTKTLKGEDAIAYQLQQKEEEIAKQRELIALIEYAKGVEDGTVATRNKSLDALAQQNGLFEKGVDLAKKLNDAESDLTTKEEDAKSLGLSLKKYEAFRKALEGVKAKTILWADSIKDVLSGFDAVLDAFGVAEDSTTRLWIQNAIKIADMIAQVIILTASLEAMGVAANSALGIIGWIAMALQAVAMLMAGIFGYQDKKQQKAIERLERQVRNLESAYKDLERAIESAYSVETLKGSYEESIDNINKRIESTYKMIDAERDKKDTDQGRIDEWLEQIKELEREKKELQEEIVTGLGGSYDIRNTTREFVEAWIEAFNETGNGLHGLEENFKESFKNILIEQAVMKGAGKLMEPLLKEINASLEDDYKVSTVEMEKILSTSNVVFDRVNEYLSEMFGEGSPLTDWISDSADNLTGLQKGIQGITESQADIIAAYLNSMRAYVADNNLKLTQMLDAWTNTEVENPMVAQLKIIATQTTAIHDLLGGLTKGGHSEGGKGLKVFIS